MQGCYGVRPVYTDEATFAAAHEQLEEMLPGSGPLAERYQGWRDSILVPAEQVERTMAAVIEQARSQTRDFVDLPVGEGVVLELTQDEPWMAYNFYLGDLRGRVAVNTSLPMSAIELLHLAIHETYPGHQAERAAKEQLLVRGRGMIEETLVLSPTPQSLISEVSASWRHGCCSTATAGPSWPRSFTAPASSSISRRLGRSSRPGCNAIGQW